MDSYHLPQKVNWKPEHKKSLEQPISHITSPPIMAYPDFNLPYIVYTDASEKGLGAVLYRKQDNQIRLIASRTLTQSEKNYHMHSGKVPCLKVGHYRPV